MLQQRQLDKVRALRPKGFRGGGRWGVEVGCLGGCVREGVVGEDVLGERVC